MSKFYLILDGCHGFYRDHLRKRAPGSRVLEIGCGQDSNALFMARQGAAEVLGIDISSVAIAQAWERARREQVQGGVQFRAMDAENLDMPGDSFDLICGVAILHHLDLRKALSHMARTLRPGGTAVFLEPLAHNPIINLYRRLTPSIRTPDEHPLYMKDLNMMEEYFGRIEKKFFHFSSLLMAPLSLAPIAQTDRYDRMVRFFDNADQRIFKAAPYLRRYAWTVGLILSEPRRFGGDSRTGIDAPGARQADRK